ncbi:hypothetical protein O181_028419 [Austropuccinia psidii MF-1]|uniref:N-acetylglucosaminylphosphatidylinositol deacetylase n=1 Tax=Austropuccinia psidii MF-1 TaxID=1389203 RepID=A0A9Q3CQM9_9BASI|nr:hypothetical protein [Austropuccinia psidii MF-1]
MPSSSSSAQHQHPPSSPSSTPISPLLDSLADRSSNLAIRESDYGDREDVLAETEELQHQLAAFDSANHSVYPPNSWKFNQSFKQNSGRYRKGFSAFSLGIRNYRIKFKILLFLIALWPIFSWATIYYLLLNHPALLPPSLKNSKSTLLVVAHPDDECLFFAPSVLATVWRAQSHGALLVMSAGNHYGQGYQRKKELKHSCHQLGIREERCEVIDISSVQDDPKNWWPTDLISKIVKEHIDRWMIDSLITFDDWGVSGHINHRAVSAAVTQLALKLNSFNQSDVHLNPSPILFTLQSVSVLRKYSGLYDLPISLIGFIPSIIFGPPQQKTKLPLIPDYDSSTESSAQQSEKNRKLASSSLEKGLLLSGWHSYRAARKAFWSHHSQLVWDRHLYMILSRYMYFNTIQRVV